MWGSTLWCVQICITSIDESRWKTRSSYVVDIGACTRKEKSERYASADKKKEIFIVIYLPFVLFLLKLIAQIVALSFVFFSFFLLNKAILFKFNERV